MWKEKPMADIKDLEVVNLEKAQQPVLLRYSDPSQYKSIMEPLIRLESDYDRQYKESQT
jgi:hypothetical protein